MNENYFSKIDSHEKAYILGFIYADGSVQCKKGHYTLEITQNVERKDVLEHIIKALDTNVPLKEYVPGKLSLLICSKK
jgi:DNA-binding transcriptional regulator WhiA